MQLLYVRHESTQNDYLIQPVVTNLRVKTGGTKMKFWYDVGDPLCFSAPLPIVYIVFCSEDIGR